MFLVLLLSISDSMYPLCALIFFDPPDSDHEWRCKLEGILISFFAMSSILLSSAIAKYMYNTVLRIGYTLTKKELYKYCILVYTIAAFDALVPFKYYGAHANLCWLDTSHHGIILQIFCFYGQVIVLNALNLWCYYSIRSYLTFSQSRQLSRQGFNSEDSNPDSPHLKILEVVRSFQYYPGINLLDSF